MFIGRIIIRKGRSQVPENRRDFFWLSAKSAAHEKTR